MHHTCLREDTDAVGIHAADHILVIRIDRLNVSFICGRIDHLRRAEMIHQEHDFLFFDLFFLKDSLFCICDLCFSLESVFFLDRFQILDDHLLHGILIVQDFLVFRDLLQEFLILFFQLQDLQTDQFCQPEVQNCLCLFLRKGEFCCFLLGFFGLELDILHISVDQAVLCLGEALGPADHFDDQIDHVTGFDQTFFDLFLLTVLIQQRRIFPGIDLILEVNAVTQDAP